MIVRHTLVRVQRRGTLPATEPPLGRPLPRVAHHSDCRLDLLGLKDFLLNNDLHGGGLRDVRGRGRCHDVGGWRGNTAGARRLLDSDRRLDRVVLGVRDRPGLGRKLDSGFG